MQDVTSPEARDAARIISCREPATGQFLANIPVDSPDVVREKVKAARAAARIFAKSSFDVRKSLLRHVLRDVLTNADEYCDYIVRDSGKTRENAMMGEIWPIAEKIRWTIANGEKHLRPERVSSGMFLHKRATIEYVPRGVIGVICPWNYPLQNILGPTISSLMAGNAVVVKVSEHVAWSSERFKRIFEDALKAHGLPTELVTIIQGFGETGAALVSSGVDLVVFTGSMANGRKVLAESAKTLTPVILELGGKDALIVCDDADLEQAAHAAINGAFIAAGQNCLAAERILVMDGIYDRFVARVTDIASNLRQATPTSSPGNSDVGALVTKDQVGIVAGLVSDALAQGARAIVGGVKPESEGNWYPPTVLVDVTSEMKIAQEETFGPVLSILRVHNDDDAVRVANATQYGLGCSVFSRDAARAKRIADAVESGSASVNDFGFTYMAQDLPFGGVRGSGFGRLNGRDGLRACTHSKGVLEDRFSFHAPAKLYPVKETDYDMIRGVLRVLYGEDAIRKEGAMDLVKTAKKTLSRYWPGSGA